MDANSGRTSQGVPLFTAHGHVDDGSAVDHTAHPAACVLCRRTFAPDNNDFETVSICGDCKFLLLEDLGDPRDESVQRRRQRGGRTRYNSSESVEDLFSQHLSHMINLVRQSRPTISGRENQSTDGDTPVRPSRTSSRTTPTSSRRWQRLVVSDTESEGFENSDSLYGEHETTPSSNWRRAYLGESDAISFSAYGGDSDASVDGHSFLDTDVLFQPDVGSNLDSDTDIDPMHAGLNQWNSDDEEDEDDDDDDDDGEWEEADIVEDTNESREAGPQIRNTLISSLIERDHSIDWRRQLDSPEFEGLNHWRARQGRRTHNITRDIFANLVVPELHQYVGNSGDYLDARGFEDLLEHLAETDSSRRGAPPAAVSLVNSLPRVVINKGHGKHDDLTCAICKDVLTIGTEVNQLPCLHLYHPYCILPWLSTRNSCPLCRFELPTDDKDYEEGKQRNSNRIVVREIQPSDSSDDSSSDEIEAHEFDQGGTNQRGILDVNPAASSSGRRGSRRWLLLAAAPIVGLVGIVLVYWLGNPQGRGATLNCNFPQHRPPQIHAPRPSSASQRGNRSRRWWSFF